ncbi:hypothetical protein LZ906_013535 [Paraclostridium ghonii]|uniref:hypothetical protein n=1 Tax=Paraclostridium ghonii TaxID=29358 RepID=UPI00202CCAE8|nr:hypothetical protein [Paeniclostridium ghonii]MCM0166089.1 hypothetical protein [Paeniclostridium ghonii]
MSKTNRGNDDKSKLCCFGYVDYIVLASTLAIAVAEEVNASDLNILASFFATFSDELALIAAVKVTCAPNSETNSSGETSPEENIFVPPTPTLSRTKSNPKVKKRKKVKKYKKV